MEEEYIQIDTLTVKIKNFQNDPLFAYPEQSFVTFKSDVQGEKAEMYMDEYEEVADSENGDPVVISSRMNNKTYLLCVANNSVILKESEVPENIQSEGSEFLFFKRDLTKDLIKLTTFESSVKSGSFLAYGEEDRSLILRPYDKDKLDEFATFFIVYLRPGIKDFKRYGEMIPYLIWNNNKDLMIALPEESIAIFEPEGPDTKEEQVTFFMAKYRSHKKKKGLAVSLSCEINNRNFLLWGENNSITLKECEVPTEIPKETSELIFYRRHFSKGSPFYRFESSFCEKYFLAWGLEDSKKKLMLKKYSEQEIKETMMFDLQKTSVPTLRGQSYIL